LPVSGPRRARWSVLAVFLTPALILLTLFVIVPILGTVVISFQCKTGFCLKNYVAVITQQSPDLALIYPPGFGGPPPWGALIHNIVWILIHVPLTTMLGLFIAYILRDTVGGSFIKSIVFIGMVIPMVVGGLIIRFMFDKYVGIVPKIFQFLGVKSLAVTWTSYPQTALIALILGSVWLWTGFSMTIYSAALETIPKDYIEAAKVDGASERQIFFKIILPLLKPATLVVVLMTILWDLKIFDIVFVATLGGPGGASTVMALVMYMYFARELDFAKAAAVAVLLALLTLIPGAYMARRAARGE